MCLNIIGEPKYKYGQQEQVTVRNHNRSTALERSGLKYWELKLVLRDPNIALSFCHGPTSPSASVMAHGDVAVQSVARLTVDPGVLS